MPAAKELIAHGREKRICAKIKGLVGLSRSRRFVRCVTEGNPTIRQYEDSVFSGQYITGDPKETYLKELEVERGDHAQVKRLESNE